MVGSSLGSASTPCLWEGTTAVNLQSAIGSGAGVACAINSNGDIAGDAEFGFGRPSTLPHGGSVTVLPPLNPANPSGVGNGMNDAGQVVGYMYSTDASNNVHAYVWSAAAGIVDLGGFDSNVESSANAINASGQVVGFSNSSDGGQDAAIWTYNGSTWTLSNLNSTHSVVHGSSIAYAINQYGDAVGWASSTAASTRQPVPCSSAQRHGAEPRQASRQSARH